MTKILITEFINQDSLNDLNNIFEIKFDEKLWKKNEELTEIIKDYDGLIVRNKTQVSKHILSNAKNLKFVGKLEKNELLTFYKKSHYLIYPSYCLEVSCQTYQKIELQD